MNKTAMSGRKQVTIFGLILLNLLHLVKSIQTLTKDLMKHFFCKNFKTLYHMKKTLAVYKKNISPKIKIAKGNYATAKFCK